MAMYGTVTDAAEFDAEADAQALRKAMKGIDTDEKAITNIVGRRSNRQRQKIKQIYKTLFGQDLIEKLKSELSGNYETLVVDLFMTPAEYDAYSLKKAMKGAGTDEEALIEILCTRNNAQIKAATEQYKKKYNSDLSKDIQDETSGHFKRLMFSLSQGSRFEKEPLDAMRAAKDARTLYEAGEAKWGTDESGFNAILASRSFPQLRNTFDEYYRISKRTLDKAIESEMSGDLKAGFLAIVKSAMNPSAFFAERLYKSMKGLGTNDSTLIRIMVSRSEIDLIEIKKEFQKLYGKTLAQFIAGDCSGDYKKLLLTICGTSF